MQQQIEGLAARLVAGYPESANSEAGIETTVHSIGGETEIADEGPGSLLPESGNLQESAPALLCLSQDSELLSDFILESRDHLTFIESQLLTLDRNPHDSESLHAVFRGFHTIKGLAGFLGLWEVQSIAHDVETVLEHARNSQWIITAAAIEVILEAADYLSRWLTHLESLARNQVSETPRCDSVLLSRIASLGHTMCGFPALKPTTALAASTSVAAGPRVSLPPAIPANRLIETVSVKVDASRLDKLIHLAEEMAVAESLIRNDPEVGRLSEHLRQQIAHLWRISSELKRTAMTMRMVPIGPVFRRMARLARDLSRQFGKTVEMQTEGDEIDLDRTIAGELSDPLMHMIRNALDHGIEPPKERESRGKNPVAKLRLKAHHHAGHVIIEIADDGRGLNVENIKAKALQKGLIKPDAELSDNEIFNLIFEPGLTTAAQVTSVSGRGVGMDVVRRYMEKLRGCMEIRSSRGCGTTFLLKLPSTLASDDGGGAVDTGPCK